MYIKIIYTLGGDKESPGGNIKAQSPFFQDSISPFHFPWDSKPWRVIIE